MYAALFYVNLYKETFSFFDSGIIVCLLEGIPWDAYKMG